jgi:hypothetical protein
MKRTTLFPFTHLSMISCAFYLVIYVGPESYLFSEKRKTALCDKRILTVSVFLIRLTNIFFINIISGKDLSQELLIH